MLQIKNINNNSKGMTLVELLVAIAIFSTVISIIYGIYISNVKYIDKENIKTTLQNEAQVIDSTFLQLSMQSKGIVDCSLNNTDEFQEVKFIALEYEGNVIKWEVEDSKLKLQVISNYELDTEVVENEYYISENIKSFAAKSIDKDNLEESKLINIKIELEKQKGFNKVTYPLSVIVTFRNKE